MRSPIFSHLPILLALLAGQASLLVAQGEPLPELAALEEVDAPGGRILATAPRLSRLLALELPLDSTAFPTWQVVAERGLGQERPVDVDAGAGLHLLVLDAARHAISQFDRNLHFQGSQKLPEDLDLQGPDFLGISQGRCLVVADSRTGTVAVRRPGEEWRVLLDFARSGPLKPTAMAVLGESVFLLDQGPEPRLLCVGTEGGKAREWPFPAGLSLHPGREGELLLLAEVQSASARIWELSAWPQAHLASRGDAMPRPLILGRYAPPGGLIPARPLDFLPLDSGPAPRLLVALPGAPAQVLDALPESAP